MIIKLSKRKYANTLASALKNCRRGWSPVKATDCGNWDEQVPNSQKEYPRIFVRLSIFDTFNETYSNRDESSLLRDWSPFSSLGKMAISPGQSW